MLAKRWSSIACLLTLLLWSGVSPAAPIKIGEINPLTGKLAQHGLEIHRGVELAVAELNEAGGLGGRPVELVSRDDQSQPDVAISRAEELCAKEKVLGLTGGYVDSLVGPIAEVARKYEIPYVASASLQKELVLRNNPYFFRVARLQGFVDPLCAFLTERLQPQRLAIVYAATPGATEFALDLRQCLRDTGISVLVMEKFRPGTPDFTPLIAKLASLNIEVIVSGGFFPDHILFVRQLKENRVSPKAYLGLWGIAYESFLTQMGEDADELYGTCAWNPGITFPGTQTNSRAFIQRFRRMYNREPNTTNMHGYTSTRGLLAAMQEVLRRGQVLSSPHIRKALAGIDLLLPMERLSFDERGDPRFYRHVIVQIQNGRFVVVYPPERATGSTVYPMTPWDQRK